MPHTSIFCHGCILSSGILFMCSLMFAYTSFLGPLLFPCIFSIPLLVYSSWPYHLSHFCLAKIVVGSMLVSLQMFSFFVWSFFVLPLESGPSQQSHLVDVEPYFIKQLCTNAHPTSETCISCHIWKLKEGHLKSRHRARCASNNM